MKLIFGLGNPGKEYVGTRHNAGFDTLDSYAIKNSSSFIKKDRFIAEIAELSLHDEKVVLARPLTFYNNVGESFTTILSFYNFNPMDCLIIHDELALPFGTLRVRQGGSDAGNNGIKSINIHGGATSMRLRFGIATEKRSLVGDTSFVLSKFNKEEIAFKESSLYPTAHSVIEQFINGSLEAHSVKHEINPNAA